MGISGGAVFTGGDTKPGAHNIDYLNGLFSSLGYTFANNAASRGELVVIAQSKIPDDVIVEAQKPPTEIFAKEPLPVDCGGDALITSSAGSVFERFISAEDDACGLDFTADESADEDDRGKNKKNRCGADAAGESAQENTQKL